MADDSPLEREAEEIRLSGLLGRSEILVKLFDYLASSSLEQRSPKEIEIATEVFGRSSNFDAGRDAVVRVYIHKLRRRLETIYAGPRDGSQTRLAIPLGEYRLVLAPGPSPGAPTNPPPLANWTPRRGALAAALLVLVAVLSSVVTVWVEHATLPPAVKEVAEVRRGPIWAPLLSNRFPTLIVLGDYYIFGESDDGMETNRLVREYAINTQADLDMYLAEHPEKVDHYIDLGLQYLPVGAGYALRQILPASESWGTQKSTRIVLASQLTPDMLKADNIVYVGYLSALGALRDTVFAGSRFSVGETYDELIDAQAKTHFVSQGGGPASSGAIYRDYGYFSTFTGPPGNKIIIIAGTRDVGLMQTAEAAAHAGPLKQMAARAGQDDSFEALYEVDAMDRLNLSGRLVLASPLASGNIWTGGARLHFPAG